MNKAFKLICLIPATIILRHASPLNKTQWKGKIEYEDGIKVIKKPGRALLR
jgi:hypothetical protein